MEIPQHTFLITGAGSGLGKATAQLFAKYNANIVIADVDSEAGSALASELEANALFMQTDVNDASSVEATIAEIQKRFGTIHGVINCAGVLVAERIIRKEGILFDLDLFRKCVDINLTGTFNMIRLTSKLLVANSPSEEGERGVIINTASIAAFEGQIGQAAYAASKAGVIGMTLPIARELGRFGIRVMTIAPGIFDTPLFEQLSQDQRQQLEEQVPFPQRLGRPEHFAALAKHIIENPMLNGETIRLDGALRMAAK